MATLILVRHGDNDYLTHNKLPGHLPGIHLNERGRKQALDIERTLNGLPIKAIYASPLERAMETAEPLARFLGLEIQTQPDLTDINVGDWAGRSWKSLRRTKSWKVIQDTPSQFKFPNGETFVQAQERVVAALDLLATAHKDELITLIFHADPIKLAVAHYLGLPVDHFQRLTVSTGSVSILNLKGFDSKLLALNLIPPFSFPNI